MWLLSPEDAHTCTHTHTHTHTHTLSLSLSLSLCLSLCLSLSLSVSLCLCLCLSLSLSLSLCLSNSLSLCLCLSLSLMPCCCCVLSAAFAFPHVHTLVFSIQIVSPLGVLSLRAFPLYGSLVCFPFRSLVSQSNSTQRTAQVVLFHTSKIRLHKKFVRTASRSSIAARKGKRRSHTLTGSQAHTDLDVVSEKGRAGENTQEHLDQRHTHTHTHTPDCRAAAGGPWGCTL
jgi:hypothetical protein